MNTRYLVNPYVLANLFYEVIFIEKYSSSDAALEADGAGYLDKVIQRLVVPKYSTFRPETQAVIKNTLRYFLATKSDDWGGWSEIWEAAGSPVLLPYGVRPFMERVHRILFVDDRLPCDLEIAKYTVNNDFHIANLLN